MRTEGVAELTAALGDRLAGLVLEVARGGGSGDPWIPAAILGRIGFSSDEIQTCIATRYLDEWTHDATGHRLRPVNVMLSPLAAERLGLHLVEGANETKLAWRWEDARLSKPDEDAPVGDVRAWLDAALNAGPAPKALRWDLRVCQLGHPEYLPWPEEETITVEEIRARKRDRRRRGLA